MERIEEIFVKELAREELKIYEYLDNIKKIKRNERDRVNKEKEALTYLTNNGQNIDFDSLKILGLKNSAKFFRMMCKLYKETYFDKKDSNLSILYNPDIDDINVLRINKDKVEFTLGEILYKLYDVIIYNYEINMNEGYIIVDGELIFNITLMNTLSRIYFPIKSLTKGHSYSETSLVKKGVKVPKNFQLLSEELISKESLDEPGLRKVNVRGQIYNILEDGVSYINNLDSKKLSLTKNEK